MTRPPLASAEGGRCRATARLTARRPGRWRLYMSTFQAVLLLEIMACCRIHAAVVEFTDRLEWERAVKHFTAVPHANTPLEKDVPLNVGLVTVVASGRASTSCGTGTNGTLSLSGSGTTRPSFRYDVKINGGKVCAIGWDWSNGGHLGMYKSVLIHDGGTTEKSWPGPGRGFLGYVDSKGKTISAFWFGSTGGCNFTGAGIDNICLSNLQPPPGIESVPPEWAAFSINWKRSWDETMAANTEQQWQKELSDSRTLSPALQSYIATNSDAARFIIGLRGITLLKAMVERFPGDDARCLEACRAISQKSREMILPWWPDPKASPFGRLGDFPGNFELTTRWEALTGAAKFHGSKLVVHPEAVHGLLSLSDRNEAYLKTSRSHYVSYASALDRMLRSMSLEQLAPLREDEEKAFRYFAGELRRKGELDEAVRLSRRAPWASSVHELLQELGELCLQEGRIQWAVASFDDVLNHASDPEVRLRARAGQWLALAQEACDRSLLDNALATVPDDTQMPWRGGTIAAGELKKKLLVTKAPGAVKLVELVRKSIQLPQSWPANERSTDGPLLDFGLHSPWPVSQVQAAGGALFVLGPARAARFNLDGGGPAWIHTPVETSAPAWDPVAAASYSRDVPGGANFDRRPITARAGRSPALSDDGGIIYWLVTSTNQAVVALDAATGNRLWSTASNADWRDLVPMSRPTAADGRVYVLAIPAGLGPGAGLGSGREPGPPVSWRLVCMGGRDGRVFWVRTLGWQPYTLLDIARGSCGVTIRHGVVYCSTDMGVVARCDARDGAVDWVRGYAGMVDADPRSNNFSREGSCPLVVGNTLLVAPRDHSGVMAFRCDTGELLWETIAVPSDRLIGVSMNMVLTMNERRLCALDSVSGRTIWSRVFPEGTGSQGVIIGGDAIVVSAGMLHRIAVATGATIETMDLGQNGGAVPVLLESGMVVEVKAPSAGEAKPVSK